MGPIALIGAVLLSGIAIGTAQARFLAGVAGNQLAGVAVGEGLILFSGDTHQDWRPATGTDTEILYTAVVATPASAAAFVAVADDGSAWRSTIATGSNFVQAASAAGVPLRALAQLGSQLVAVGDGGTIVRSFDLNAGSWVPIASPTSRDLFGIATNGISSSVAVGELGTILRGNLQGTEWAFIQIEETETFHAVVTNPDGRFLAVGDRGALWVSDPNGTNWTSARTSISTNLLGAARIGPATVIVGSDRSAYFAAQNFTNWQLAVTPSDRDYDLFAVTYTEEDLIAVGNHRTLLWSSIGLQWSMSTVTPVVETSWGRVKAQYGSSERTR